jgi:Acyl-CoA thioesterase C-terminal domain/Acyl-CoA thioesterase N-terminal domain
MPNTEDQAFFKTDNDGYFVGNDSARGPWSEHACHAGPVAGLIARAFEHCISDKRLVRVTIDLNRPVPMAGMKINAKTVKIGKKVSTASAELIDRNGTICATATSLHIATTDIGPTTNPKVEIPEFNMANNGGFPVSAVTHAKPGFGNYTEIVYPAGEDSSPGPTTLWMRNRTLVEGEETSPFQKLCPLADCGNGISRNADMAEMSFMNCDLTITCSRDPNSEWLASQCISFWEDNGMGLSQATLMDTHGAVATAVQSIILIPPTKAASK